MYSPKGGRKSADFIDTMWLIFSVPDHAVIYLAPTEPPATQGRQDLPCSQDDSGATDIRTVDLTLFVMLSGHVPQYICACRT